MLNNRPDDLQMQMDGESICKVNLSDNDTSTEQNDPSVGEPANKRIRTTDDSI